MANETADRPGSLLGAVTRMVEAAVNEGSYETLIHVLSLICLVSILGHGQMRAAQTAPAGGASPLQKILGDLTKGEGGLGPDALVSLLPLLNSPQLKNKLNPATIATLMGLLGNMGGDKAEPAKAEKAEKTADKAEPPKADKPADRVIPPTAATVTSPDLLAENPPAADPADPDRKGLGKYLNWKGNF